MEDYKSLTEDDLFNIIKSSQEALFLCIPSLHENLCQAIVDLHERSQRELYKVGIHILIDYNENTFRQGYGHHDSVENLFRMGLDIKTLETNRISFIISDKIGYYLFLESKALFNADKQTINAAKIDSLSLFRLKSYFFESESISIYQHEVLEELKEETDTFKREFQSPYKTSASTKDIDSAVIKETQDALDKNPPLNPDYKRIVETYSNKFQYVKLKFEGSNVQHRTIKIPQKAMPVSDTALKKKLRTKLNLFTKDNEEACFKPLNDFKKRLEEIREKFLFKVKSREESLLEKGRKQKFKEMIASISDDLKELRGSLLTNMSQAIEKTKKDLSNELEEFFIENPKALFQNQEEYNEFKSNHDYTREQAKAEANNLIIRIAWPKAHELLSAFNIDVQYSDITYEDLKSDSFLQELKAIKLIDEADINKLAEFNKTIELK